MKKIFFCSLLLAMSIFCFILLRQSSFKASNSPIESMFEDLFSEGLSYVLIGKKPIAIGYVSGFYLRNSEIKAQFFKHLTSFFKNSNCYFLKTIHWSNSYIEVILIHKLALLKKIKKEPYLKNFIKIEYDTVNNFFEKLALPDYSIQDCFYGDPIALGIALGYGENNSRFFVRRSELGRYLQKYPFAWYASFSPNPDFQCLEERPLIL